MQVRVNESQDQKAQKKDSVNAGASSEGWLGFWLLRLVPHKALGGDGAR